MEGQLWRKQDLPLEKYYYVPAKCFNYIYDDGSV